MYCDYGHAERRKKNNKPATAAETKIIHTYIMCVYNRPKKIEIVQHWLCRMHVLHRNHARSTYHLLVLRFRADKYLLLKRPYHIYEMKQGNEYE